MTEPDLSYPVTYRLPREGIWVQIWFAGHDQRWTYAKRRGDMWLVDSRELPSDVPITDKIVTRWRDAAPPPGEIDYASIEDYLRDADGVIELPVGQVVIEAPRKQLPG